MTPGAFVALLALAVVAVATRPGDGRSETAIAVPLVAAVGVSTPLALSAVLAGVLVAYVCLIALESRTLLFGRRLRAITAVAGATVPLAIVAAGAVLGRVPSHPEVWLAGSVVPGVLAYDLRRQSLDRRTVTAVAGTAALLAFVLVGVLSQALLGEAPGDLLSVGSAAPTVGVPLGALAGLVLGGLAAGVLLRWRYGLHVAPLSVPLVAVWTLESVVVPLTYVAALAVVWFAAPTLRSRGGGRRAAAAGGFVGALLSAAVFVAGGASVLVTGGLAVLLAGVLGAEDARLLRGHAGRDRTHAVAVAASTYALLLLGGGVASTAGAAVSRASLVAATTALAVIALVVAQRERARPSEQRLRTEERRWTP